MTRRSMIALAAGVLLCAPLVFLAQVSIPSRQKSASKTPDEVPRPDLRVDRTEVLVPVAVNDTLNRPVSGLEKENFSVFDDKVEQTITKLFDGRRAGGRGTGVRHQRQHERGSEREERAAANEFFKTANPEDGVQPMVEFDSRPRAGGPGDSRSNQSYVPTVVLAHAKGSTALLDAVFFLGFMRSKKSNKKRKALVVVTDGGREQQPVYALRN